MFYASKHSKRTGHPNFCNISHQNAVKFHTTSCIQVQWHVCPDYCELRYINRANRLMADLQIFLLIFNVLFAFSQKSGYSKWPFILWVGSKYKSNNGLKVICRWICSKSTFLQLLVYRFSFFHLYPTRMHKNASDLQLIKFDSVKNYIGALGFRSGIRIFQRRILWRGIDLDFWR